MYLAKFLDMINAISTILGLSPIFEFYKKNKIKKNYWLSDNRFTDRFDDIRNIINLLNNEKTPLFIIGEEHIQGKTWIAKKICDCINHTKEMRKYDIKHSKKKEALYFDLTTQSIDNIEKKLLELPNSSKILCIYDHCSDEHISSILNPKVNSKISHIIIPKNPSTILDYELEKYYLSKFPVEELSNLHEKIKKNYSRIDTLSEKEMQILYNLTHGNIKNISFMLNEQRTVSWIKQLAKNEQTEYDNKLNKIQILLFQGLYTEAKKVIEKIEDEDKKYIKTNSDYYSKLILIKSDCEHLLNNYNDAIAEIRLLLNDEKYKIYNHSNIFELKLGHFYKHIWECDKSIEILWEISENNSIDSKLEMLGILSCKYFIGENILKLKQEQIKTLDLYNSIIIELSNKIQNHNQRLIRHQIINDFYNKHSEHQNLIERINSVIECYRAENNRLIANSVFLKGELYRLNQEYDKAVACYQDTLTYTQDDNIKIQVEIMLYYLSNIKNIKLNIHNINIMQTTSLSQTHSNEYALALIRKLNNIKLQDPNSKSIIKLFDERIMTIL